VLIVKLLGFKSIKNKIKLKTEFNRPANLKLIGNINDNFKIFKQEVEVYFMATETYQKPKEVQVALPTYYYSTF